MGVKLFDTGHEIPLTPTHAVLVVDDEPADAELIVLAVRESGYDCVVRAASDGRAALDLLRPAASDGWVPDLILLDLNMPRMDGREFLVEMKKDPQLAAIPIVVMTTSDSPQDIESSYARGAAGFLTKPLEVEALFESVRRVEEYWFETVRLRPTRRRPPVS